MNLFEAQSSHFRLYTLIWVARLATSRLEVRDRCTSLIAQFPSPRLLSSLFASFSFALSSRLSTVVNYYCGGSCRGFPNGALPDLRSYEAYRGLPRLRERVFRKIELLPAGFRKIIKLHSCFSRDIYSLRRIDISICSFNSLLFRSQLLTSI